MKKLIALNLLGLVAVLALAALLARNAADAARTVSAVDTFTAVRMDATEVRTQMTMAGQTVMSGVKIVGERVGECP